MRTAALSLLILLAVIPFASPFARQQQPAPAGGAAQSSTLAPPSTVSPPGQVTPLPIRAALHIVVLDPAHGGTDPGARGTGGVRESDLVLGYAGQIRAALEKQGFLVVQTRQGNDNPSFDDRSALANAQRGAIFLTLHIGSTGVPGTVRVYTMPDGPAVAAAGRFLPWDRAQAAYLPLSRKLAELAQGQLTPLFKGSPDNALTATIRQLRTTAAPAIAVEISSVSVEDRGTLDQMGPGLADALARAVAAFKPVYDATPNPGGAS